MKSPYPSNEVFKCKNKSQKHNILEQGGILKVFQFHPLLLQKSAASQRLIMSSNHLITLSFLIIAKKKNRNSQCPPFVCTEKSVCISAENVSLKTKDVQFVHNRSNKS